MCPLRATEAIFLTGRLIDRQDYSRNLLNRSYFFDFALDFFFIRALASARGSVAQKSKGLKTKETATRGPEGPESGQNMRVRGPEGPEDEQNPVALASATICFSRFSQKSRFSWQNFSTFMSAKLHKNFSRVLYLRHKHRVKKSEQFVYWIKSYARLKFRKNAAFVSKWVTTYIPTRISRERTQIC